MKGEGIVFVPRLGARLTGGGTISRNCEGACSGLPNDEFDYDDTSSFVSGLDVLVPVIPELRLGVGAFLTHTQIETDEENGVLDLGSELETDQVNGDLDLGSDLTLPVIVEGMLRVSPSVSVALRGFVGVWMLFPGGDLDTAIMTRKVNCDFAPTLSTCEVDDGPYVGPTFGFGPGLVVPLSGRLRGVSLRVDLYFQWYSAKILSTEHPFQGESVETSNTLTGSRVLLMGGVEF